jgi:ribonuclease R
MTPQKSTDKQQKIIQNLSKVIQQFLAGKRYEPMGQKALLQRLKIPKTLESLCKKILEDLVEQGIIEVHNKQFALKKEEINLNLIKGTLRLHHRGFGFVIPDNPADSAQDVFIPKHLTDNAVDGDVVEIEINPDSSSEKGPEGRIVSIVKRGRTHLAGTIRLIEASGDAVAYVPLLGSSKPVKVKRSEEFSLKVGDRVILKVLEWGDQKQDTVSEVTHYIGHISDPSCDIKAAIEEFDLGDIFSRTALNEAKAYGTKVSAKDLKGRKDLTKITSFTIDPDTAKDYDDALSIKKDRKGGFSLAVHIADVAHYVPQDSALDKEAYTRCNSTYFPNVCLPMLPEELSNQLCSLRANVIRLTVSVLMDFDKEGHLLKAQIVRAYIKSAKRFTYGEAKLVLDGKKKSVHAKSLKEMVELCLLLKKKRSERGSIDFALPETVIEVSKDGNPTGLKVIEYDITHQLVEEFMLKANEVVAKTLSDRGKPLVYRVHESPSLESFEDFFALARSLGFTLPEKPTHQEIQELFDKAKDTPFGQQLSVGFIRSMRLACYSPDNVGHYGLALEHYTHFTSPIRRYTDLVIQRLLFDEEEEDIDLEKVALKCSEQERISFRAEMSVKTLKKLRLLESYLKEDPTRIYQATVTRVKPFGVFFELPGLMLEGFLHISDLEDDFFVFDPVRGILYGKTTGKRHFLGEVIPVQLESVDCIMLESKWSLVAPKRKKRRR